MIKITHFAISTRINNYFVVNKREKRQIFKPVWKISTRSSYRQGQAESFCLKESPFGTIFQCQNKATNLLALIKKQACLKDIIMNFMKNIMVKVNYFFCFLVSKFCRFFFFFWSVSGDKFKDVISIVIGLVSSFIDNSVSDAIKISGHISLAKNVFWMKYWDHYCWH